MTDQPIAKSAALECFWLSLRLGLTSFGGPVAHLGYFERAYVQQRRWLTAENYAGLVGLCQALPGPASSQVNFLIGLQRAGFTGALLSFLGFTLPSAALMFAAVWWMNTAVPPEALLHGLKIAAAVIVAQAVWSMAPKLCPDWPRRILGAVVFIVTLLFGGMFTQLAVLLLGALGGLFFCRHVSLPQGLHSTAVSPRAALRCLTVFLLLLVSLPVMAEMMQGEALVTLVDTFYRAGALVFGGGHVVLPLLHATSGLGNDAFMAIYGVAQALPGPLFAIAAGLGAAMLPSAPWLGGLLGLGFIFLPGFLVAIAGFYYWQAIAHTPRAAGALAGVNAAVVGLLASAFVHPVLTSAFIHSLDLAFILIAFVLLEKYKLPPLVVVLMSIGYAFAMGALGA
jgi:chromate transporter